MNRKFVLVLGLCAGLSLFWGIHSASAASEVAVQVAPDDIAVLNAALDELKGILLALQDSLKKENTSSGIDVVAVSLTLNQISFNLSNISIAFSEGGLIQSKNFAAKDTIKIQLNESNGSVLAGQENQVRAFSLESFLQYRKATFTLLAMLLVFGFVVFLRRDSESESVPA